MDKNYLEKCCVDCSDLDKPFDYTKWQAGLFEGKEVENLSKVAMEAVSDLKG